MWIVRMIETFQLNDSIINMHLMDQVILAIGLGLRDYRLRFTTLSDIHIKRSQMPNKAMGHFHIFVAECISCLTHRKNSLFAW